MTKSDFLQLQELQRDSGLTLMKYLRENGLSYSTYNYWKRKFYIRTQKNPRFLLPRFVFAHPRKLH